LALLHPYKLNLYIPETLPTQQQCLAETFMHKGFDVNNNF